MKKMTKIICIVLSLVLALTSVSFVTLAATSTSDVSIKAVATQQQRMWCQSNYDTTDWIYEPWGYLGYGKVLYARFYNNTALSNGDVARYVIRLDALAKQNEKTVYMAAVPLTDAQAGIVESDVTSATSTRKITSTNGGDKLMTTTTGYYKDELKDAVVAYGKATASDTAVSTPVTYGHGSYAYPVTLELDVTDYVKSVFATGKKNVQFVLISARKVLADTTDVGAMENFARFANGKVYNAAGEVILQKNRLSLDTSTPVAGNAGYYSVLPAVDPYFSWMEVTRDSISLEMKTASDDERFAAFKLKATDVAKMSAALPEISDLLDAQTYSLYASVSESFPYVNNTLLNGLKNCYTAQDFSIFFYETVNNSRYDGYRCSFTLEDGFASRRGSITVEGDCPKAAYLHITTYDSGYFPLQSFVFPVRGGEGYYNIYGKDKNAASMMVTLSEDAEGTRPLALSKVVTLPEMVLPGVFITELSNMHTNTYSPDSGSENQGSWTQYFQYIELHNYSDEDVDLSTHKFVYYDGSERTFDWILESGGSLILPAGESYVIGVYTGYSYSYGYTYDTSTARTDFWNGFQKFYNVTIPKTRRAMIACVDSGKASWSASATLRRSKEAGVTCYAALKQGSTVVTKAMLPDSKPHRGYAYQFVPTGVDNTEQLLFATGCFPYRLLKEQQPEYCESIAFNVQDDLNVLCYNILADEQYYSVDSRIPRLMDVLDTYQPDVIGFQEFNYSWAQKLPSKMPKQYSVIEGISTYNHGFSNASGTWDLLNPIYYRNDKFTVLESGSAFMTPDGNKDTAQWDSVNMKRTMTWVVLKNKQTGEIFNVVNGHLVLSGKTARIEQVKQMYGKGEALRKKHGGGMIVMGDHNMQEASEPYHAYLNGGIVVDAKYETINHNSKDTAPAVNKYDGDYGVPIDFVMINPAVIGVREYHVFDGIYADGPVSDHSGVFVRLYTKGNEDNDSPVVSGVQNNGKYCTSVTLTVSDEHLRQVFLNGTAVDLPAGGYKLTQAGHYTIKAIDEMDRQTKISFTLGEHDWETTYTIDTPADCGTAGSKSYHCAQCDTINPQSVVPIPATGNHTESALIVDTPATAVAEGKGHTICTVCSQTLRTNISIPPTGQAQIGQKGYATLDAAIADAKAGDTVKLLADCTIGNLQINPGVTLDLAGKELQADFVVGFQTSKLINSADNGVGKLVIQKSNLTLSKDNPYLPVYDETNGAYLFTRVKNNRHTVEAQAGGLPKFSTSPMFKEYVHPLMDTAAEAEKSGVKIVIRLRWSDSVGRYEGVQDYIYHDSLVAEVIASYQNVGGSVNYGKQFFGSFTGSEIAKGTSVTVSTVLRTAAGVEMEGAEVSLF